MHLRTRDTVESFFFHVLNITSSPRLKPREKFSPPLLPLPPTPQAMAAQAVSCVGYYAAPALSLIPSLRTISLKDVFCSKLHIFFSSYCPSPRQCLYRSIPSPRRVLLSLHVHLSFFVFLSLSPSSSLLNVLCSEPSGTSSCTIMSVGLRQMPSSRTTLGCLSETIRLASRRNS